MFNKKTVIVVGAGASFEAGMPVGTKLAERIAEAAKALTTPSTLGRRLDSFTHSVREHTPYPERSRLNLAASKIEQGIHLAGSIDAFIDRHQNDAWVAKLGKALIASEILAAEAASKLAGENPKTVDLTSTWYQSFASMLFTGTRVGELDNFAANLTIVCFNYDRCIEQYLLLSLMQGFALTYAEAYELMKTVRIIHPYGDIGSLPLGAGGDATSGVTPFGHKLDWNYMDPFSFSHGIRTFTEQEHDLQRQAQIHEALCQSERLIILGFSYQPQNMDLMALPQEMRREAPINDVYATGLGVSDQELKSVTRSIAKLYRLREQESFAEGRISVMLGVSCQTLFERHRLVFLNG